MRRRRKPDIRSNNLLSDIMPNLTRLEKAIAEQTVIKHIKFTPDDVVTGLLSFEHVKTLKAAFTLLKDMDRTQFKQGFSVSDLSFSLSIDCRKLQMAAWRSDIILEGHLPIAFLEMIEVLQTIVQRFSKIRTVAAWLDEHASWGAIRYYWPSACALLPNEHLIHRLDGMTYREPAIPVGPMVPLFRETAMTIAEAMLCPLDVPYRSLIRVDIGDTSFGIL